MSTTQSTIDNYKRDCIYTPFIMVDNGEHVADGQTRFYAYPIVDINSSKVVRVDFHTDKPTPIHPRTCLAIIAWMELNGMTQKLEV